MTDSIIDHIVDNVTLDVEIIFISDPDDDEPTVVIPLKELSVLLERS